MTGGSSVVFKADEYKVNTIERRRTLRQRLNALRTVTPLIEACLTQEEDLSVIEERAQEMTEALSECVDKLLEDVSPEADVAQRAQLARLIAPLLAKFGPQKMDHIRLAVLGAFQSVTIDEPDIVFANPDETQSLLSRTAGLTTMWSPLARLYDIPVSSQSLFFGAWDEGQVMGHLNQVLQEGTEQALALILRDIPVTSEKDILITKQSVTANLSSLYATILTRHVQTTIGHIAALRDKRDKPAQQAYQQTVRTAKVPPLLAETRDRFLTFTTLIYQGPRPDEPRVAVV